MENKNSITRTFNDYDNLIDYVSDIILENNDVCVVTDMDDMYALKEILLDSDEFNSTKIELDGSEEYYTITRINNKLFIEPLYDDDEIKCFEGAITIILDDILTDEEILQKADYEELIKVELDMDNEYENYENCNGCPCKNCEEKSIIDEEIEEFLINKVGDFIDEHEDEASDEELIDFVTEIYAIAFEDGQKNLLIGLRDTIDEGLNK